MSITGRLKEIVKKNPRLLSRIYYVFMNNKVQGRKNNTFSYNNAFIRGLRLSFYGKGNEVIIGGENPSILNKCFIEIHGSSHRVFIDGGVGAKDLTIYCADTNSCVRIKDNTQIAGKTELAVMEGTKIEIGEDCLFSANITLRAGDSHSVVDMTTGDRVNQSRDIIIGNHVWIGNTVIVTKGTEIGAHCVVATGSVVPGKQYPAHSVIAGNPAKVVKEGISWLAEKI